MGTPSCVYVGFGRQHTRHAEHVWSFQPCRGGQTCIVTTVVVPRAHRWWALAAFAVAVAIAAGVGGLGVAGTAAEYDSLRQPA
jgi:hypothetical protein